MENIIEEIEKIGIVPVIVLEDAEDAIPLAKALIDGGIPCAEVTFRTKAAKEAIKLMSHEFPQMVVGAGTVLTTEQADEAVAAGARFIVSPGLNPEVVRFCQSKNIPVIPGVITPTEIEAAMGLGISVVKFFPAEAAGGIAMIKAISAPYSTIRFMPTGGITADNLEKYLSLDNVLACGGSWMVKKDLISNKRFAEITALAKAAIEKVNNLYMKNANR